MARIMRQYEAAGAPPPPAAGPPPPPVPCRVPGRSQAACATALLTCVGLVATIHTTMHGACPSAALPPARRHAPTPSHHAPAHHSPPCPRRARPLPPRCAGVERQQEELSMYVEDREARRGDPEEEGSTRGLRASAGARATDERDATRLEAYLPLQPNGCAPAARGGGDVAGRARLRCGVHAGCCRAAPAAPGGRRAAAPRLPVPPQHPAPDPACCPAAAARGCTTRACMARGRSAGGRCASSRAGRSRWVLVLPSLPAGLDLVPGT